MKPGDMLTCVNTVEGDFTKDRKYEVVYGPIDCYSNYELVVVSDKGTEYFVFGDTFNLAFKPSRVKLTES